MELQQKVYIRVCQSQFPTLPLFPSASCFYNHGVGFHKGHGFEMVCVHTQNLPWIANRHIHVGCNDIGNQFHGFQITTVVVNFLCVIYVGETGVTDINMEK